MSLFARVLTVSVASRMTLAQAFLSSVSVEYLHRSFRCCSGNKLNLILDPALFFAPGSPCLVFTGNWAPRKRGSPTATDLDTGRYAEKEVGATTGARGTASARLRIEPGSWGGEAGGGRTHQKAPGIEVTHQRVVGFLSRNKLPFTAPSSHAKLEA